MDLLTFPDTAPVLLISLDAGLQCGEWGVDRSVDEPSNGDLIQHARGGRAEKSGLLRDRLPFRIVRSSSMRCRTRRVAGAGGIRMAGSRKGSTRTYLEEKN